MYIAKVVPHNLFIVMFSPSSDNVLPFDPHHGADQARGYAGKYASKPEKYFYMEIEKNSAKFWLKARTVGVCSTYNRLLNFHVVRSTKPVLYASAKFVPDSEYSWRRTDFHLDKHPQYPDPIFYLDLLGKYYFRHASLLHLRMEQFNRYLYLLQDDTRVPDITSENTREEEEDIRFVDTDHRHYDAFMEIEVPAAMYPARLKGVLSAKRRMHSRLAVNRTSFLEPIGQTREAHYQQRRDRTHK